MKIRIRLMGHDLPVVGYSPLQLEQGSVVKNALNTYLLEHEIGIGIKELSKSQFIVNKKHCSINEELHDDDELTVIRYLGGG